MLISFKEKSKKLIESLKCDENILIKSKRCNIKKLILIIAVVGFCLSIFLAFISAGQNADYYKDNVYTYKLHRIPGQAVKTYGTSWVCYCDICCRFNYANSIEDFVSDKLISEPYYLIPLVIAILTCCLLYFISRSSKLTGTGKRVSGKVAGVEVEDKKMETVNDITEEVTENSENEKSPETSQIILKSVEVSENFYSTQQRTSKLKKAKDFFAKYQKQTIFAGVFILILCISIFGFSANSNNSDYNSNDNYTNKTSYTPQNDYDESYLETLAASKLYNELVNHKSGLLTYSYDIDSTKYSIGTIVEENGVYIIRGTFTLYDYYGKISSNHYSETFTVRISGNSITCTTSLD